MLTARQKVTALEEGLFGFKPVKLGDDAKEHGVLLRSLQSFRRAVFTGVAALGIAFGCVWLYWQRASRAGIELAASGVRQRSTECRAIVEGVILKQDEVFELCRRLRQREIIDSFLATERKLEIELKERIQRIAKSGPESADRKQQLHDELHKEVKWFNDALGDAVEDIVAPLDRAFKDIPERISALQAHIRTELPAFNASHPRGVCGDLSNALAGAPEERAFVRKIESLAELARNSSSSMLDHARLEAWKAHHPENAAPPISTISPELVVMLLRWYTSSKPKELVASLLSASGEPRLRDEPEVDNPEDPEEVSTTAPDDGNMEQSADGDDNDDDDDDDASREDGNDNQEEDNQGDGDDNQDDDD